MSHNDPGTLQHVINCLFEGDGEKYPCSEAHREITPIVFDTSDRSNLCILSCYIDDNGVVHVDIGEEGE